MSRGQLVQAPLVIPNGTARTNKLDLRAHELVALVMPADWTAASVSFEARLAPRNESDRLTDAAPWQAVTDSAGAAITLTVAEDQYIVLTSAHLCAVYGLSQARIVASANQGAERTLIAILAPR